MRLFSRRKELQFDDPRLVGMAPLKTIDESFNSSTTTTQRGRHENDNVMITTAHHPSSAISLPSSMAVATGSASLPIQIPNVEELHHSHHHQFQHHSHHHSTLKPQRGENSGTQMTHISSNNSSGSVGNGSGVLHSGNSNPSTSLHSPTKTVLMFLPTLQQQESPKNKWLSASSACLVTTGSSGGASVDKSNYKIHTNTNNTTNREQQSLYPTSATTMLRDRNNKHSQGSNANGLGSLSTWSKRVSTTWDSMRRAESSETLTSGVISSTLNRRKTLHFYPDMDYSSNKLSDKVLAAKEKFSTLRHSNSVSVSKTAQNDKISRNKDNSTTNSSPGKQEGTNNTNTTRKIGRVESLRILLSKSNRLGRSKTMRKIENTNETPVFNGKSAKSVKVDKGTDTEDLNLRDDSSGRFNEEYFEDDYFINGDKGNFKNLMYSSTSQLASFGGEGTTEGSSVTPRRSSLNADFGHNRDSFMMKTTSCENLSSMTLNRHRDRYFTNSSSQSQQTSGQNLHKSTSTGTMTVNKEGGNAGFSSVTTMTNSTSTSSPSYSSQTMGKRSSFPYAYIRSKLTALPEEPNHSANAAASVQNPSTTDSIKSVDLSGGGKETGKNSKPRRSLSQRGFFHSMGDLLTRSSSNKDLEMMVDDEDESMLVTMPCVIRNGNKNRAPRPNSIACPPGRRMFDPLTQIRIDLLHKNPSEFDDPSQSPQLWGRRSYSIGDILTESRKDRSIMGSITNVEESGYDSDSTRTGHESPRSSMKISSSETENDHHCEINDDDENSREPSTKFTNSSSSTQMSSLMTDQQHHEFDVESTLSSVADSSTSAPSPTHSSETSSSRSSNNSSFSDDLNNINKSYGPLAYVTLSRKEAGVSNRTNGTFTKNTARTLPRSQSISCHGRTALERKKKVEQQRDQDDNADKNSQFITRTQVLSPSTEVTVGAVQAAPSLRLRNKVRDRESWNTTRAARSQSLCLSIFSVKFEKGPNKKSLGFSVVGGKDSPKGSMGIFIKRIFPYGQASEEGNITEGDEILSVNGQSLSNSTHSEALAIFKSIKSGEVVLQIARREMVKPTPEVRANIPRSNSYMRSKSISCEQLSERKI